MATFYGHKCLKQAFNIDLAQIYQLQPDFEVNTPPKLAMQAKSDIRFGISTNNQIIKTTLFLTFESNTMDTILQEMSHFPSIFDALNSIEFSDRSISNGSNQPGKM